MLNAAVTALLRNGQKVAAVNLYGRISQAQLKARQTLYESQCSIRLQHGSLPRRYIRPALQNEADAPHTHCAHTCTQASALQAGVGGECFSYTAFETAVGHWAKAIDAEQLAERDRLSEIAAATPLPSETLTQTTASPPPGEHTEASAAARAVRFIEGVRSPSSLQPEGPKPLPEGSKSISRYGLQLRASEGLSLDLLNATEEPKASSIPSKGSSTASARRFSILSGSFKVGKLLAKPSGGLAGQPLKASV